MDALSRAAPPPGSAQPGDLYVDLQSRTLWLGVDPAVDEDQFVLISDIVALQAEIDGALVEAKAYTDTQLLTRAPTVHTHTAAQITNFTTAVQAVIAATPGSTINRGMIAMFSGTLAEIGIGQWAGWALCDGANGTPNLRDKFIIGAGNLVVGVGNPAASLNTTGGGTHIHTISDTAISVAQMPQHNHTGATAGRNANHAHYVSGVTDTQGDHAHTIDAVNLGSSGSLNKVGGSSGKAEGSDYGTLVAGAHAHNWGNWTGGENVDHAHGIYWEGSSQPHGHTIVGGGGFHEHSVSSAQIRDTIPYYALAFVMKL